MGPAIIFDKSALQSLGRPALLVANSLFYTVLPDVLLHEILADLSLERRDIEPQERVAMLAKKISFHHACGSMHFRKLCIQDLLGNVIPMGRRPIVDAATAQQITTPDGRLGYVRDVQPENEAILRWSGSIFSEEDLEFAAKWRGALPDLRSDASAELKNMNLGVKSMEDAARLVDAMLSNPEDHLTLLTHYMGFLGYGEEAQNRVKARWRFELPNKQRLPDFAPYTSYCHRVYQLYYIAAAHGLLPTKSNSLIDLEYFYHTPFAEIFCSSDRLHVQMAPFILGQDQSFVEGSDLKAELDQLAKCRKADPTAMPQEDSLINGLWMKHWRRPPASHVSLSDEERERISIEMKPILEALRQQAQPISQGRFPRSP